MFGLLDVHQSFYIVHVFLFNFLLLLHLHPLLELLVLLFLYVLMKSDLILIRNLNNFFLDIFLLHPQFFLLDLPYELLELFFPFTEEIHLDMEHVGY